jgi:hypothetical protein
VPAVLAQAFISGDYETGPVSVTFTVIVLVPNIQQVLTRVIAETVNYKTILTIFLNWKLLNSRKIVTYNFTKDNFLFNDEIFFLGSTWIELRVLPLAKQVLYPPSHTSQPFWLLLFWV